uniref:Mitochondrial import inner membrane translocase subunit n=1 Tax=Chlamydomonas euryale TaxID=1486919 RepID=A0A7R9VZX6_9CHLO|mmetsp:Transcript_7556/g.22839  ORF Transcript_7556/g.22839 Transcript_7556/m.22839 type:complete len:108 (+) Transcript_7556:150-473(+)
MNFPLDSAADMPEEHKMALGAMLEQMQIRDSLKMYSNLVERCFRECTEDMRSKSLSSNEEKCVTRCCEKFMHVTGRVGMRFNEFYTEMEKAAADHLQQQQQAMSGQK